ncbi:hypothetical protein [Rhodococcus sp. ARC_M6]|uniref:hypothetical protein n=1 Tax=Rhodococcus sp. ARC_M6 TaxID=2928852 RepID=UPI001FB2DF1B|nr:hypothetical protein [Rhodococcus sp. ARC_M6]MCJ0902836.1 hypothetical protein [Rhodococcus sp. ARC_M6]
MITFVDPKRIDRQLSQLSIQRWELVDQIAFTYNMIHNAIEDRMISSTRWALSDSAAEAALISQLIDTASSPRVSECSEILRHLLQLRADLFDLDETFSRIEGPYYEHPWPRTFVDRTGTIHAAASCDGLPLDARLGWLPEVSGETDMKAAGGRSSMLCTHCLPQFP